MVNSLRLPVRQNVPVHARRCLLAALAALLLAGCDPAPPAPVPVESLDPVHRLALLDAQNKVDAISGAPMRNYDYTAEGISHDLAQADGVDVMRVTGTTKNTREGVVVIVRVHGVGRRAAGGDVEMLVCYRLEYSLRHDDPVTRIVCPSGEPLAIAKDPHLPGDIDTRLKAILSVRPAPTLDAVRAAVRAIPMDQRITRDIAEAGGAIGVAVRAGRYDCQLGRLQGGVVDVWRPSHVQLAPGELNCTAADATVGAGIHPPH